MRHTGTVQVAGLVMEAWQNELILLNPRTMGGKCVLRHPGSRGSLLSYSPLLGGSRGGWAPMLFSRQAQQGCWVYTATCLCTGVNFFHKQCRLLRHLHNTKQLGATTWAGYLHSRRLNKYRICDISSRRLYKHCSGLRGSDLYEIWIWNCKPKN